jgi:hypothetical protein
MKDKTTKVLLAVIAFGLWINVALSLLRPASVSAQDATTIERLLKGIESDLSRIQRGTCSNNKIC